MIRFNSIIKRLKERLFPKKLDTSPEQFNNWLSDLLGRELEGGYELYAIAIKGQRAIPMISGEWHLYKSLDDARKRRKSLQDNNRSVILEIR